jgi:hypothetical protein
MKQPERVNLGGLWLMNPHAPRSPQTNLDGLRAIIPHPREFPDLFTGRLPALPAAWTLDVPPGTRIQTGSELTEEGSFWDPFFGPQILRQQKFWKSDLWDGESHPWDLRTGGSALAQHEVIHAVWYDSLHRRVNHEDDPPPPLLSQRQPHRYPFRGFCWSLYYGRKPHTLADSTGLGWWLIAALEPTEYDPFGGGKPPPFAFLSAWRFSHPLADDGVHGPGATGFQRWIDTSDRFNPLGKNVFRRADYHPSNESYSVAADADELTIEPFYG